jgi:hypothetical protein
MGGIEARISADTASMVGSKFSFLSSQSIDDERGIELSALGRCKSGFRSD